MQVYERDTQIDAPFGEVWDFHSRVSGLTALTPGIARMRVEAIRGPDGNPDPSLLEPDPGVLTVGCEIDVTVQPLGIGPKQSWTSVIAERRANERAALFRDRMEDGPFETWEHSHYFYANGDSTVIRDHVEYRLPGGGLGRLAGPFAVVGFEPMFVYRHRETKRLLGGRSAPENGSPTG
jgi:ligand-binding SRPBCC domain-containing protein